MASLLEILGGVPDPRTGNAQRHELPGLLAIALVALVCGAESCVDFAEFAEDRELLLREFLSLENGLPSHDTPLADCSGFWTLRPLGRSFRRFWTICGRAGGGRALGHGD